MFRYRQEAWRDGESRLSLVFVGGWLASMLLLAIALRRGVRLDLNFEAPRRDRRHDPSPALEEIRELRRRQKERRDNYLRSSLVFAGGWLAATLPVVVALLTQIQTRNLDSPWLLSSIVASTGLSIIAMLFAALVHLALDDWRDRPDADFLSGLLLLGEVDNTTSLLVDQHREAIQSNAAVVTRMRRRYGAEVLFLAFAAALLFTAVGLFIHLTI